MNKNQWDAEAARELFPEPGDRMHSALHSRRHQPAGKKSNSEAVKKPSNSDDTLEKSRNEEIP